MKTSLKKNATTRANKGSALIAILTMLSIMFVLFTVNSSTLRRLSREVDTLDKRQTNHLATIRLHATTAVPTQ
jgi:hypothetical protein